MSCLLFEALCDDWLPRQRTSGNGPFNFDNSFRAQFIGPRLVQGDPRADPVLHELLKDTSPKIRRFARIGLRMNTHDQED